MAGLMPGPVLAVLDSFRLSAWLLFAVYLVTGGGEAGPARKRGYLIAVAIYCALAIAIDAGAVIGVDGRQIFAQLLVRIGFGVLGLLTIENLWRNTDPWRRWRVWPLCLALGLLYAYELFLFSDAFITRGRVVNEVTIQVPALRERPADAVVLSSFFCGVLRPNMGEPRAALPDRRSPRSEIMLGPGTSASSKTASSVRS